MAADAAAAPVPVAADAPAAGPPAVAAPQGQGRSRPQRERTPFVLPDPLPEVMVKRYAEPSKAELQGKLDSIDADVQKCFDRLRMTKDFYDQKTKIREAARPRIEEAKGVAGKMSGELRKLFDRKKDLTVQIKAIREADISSGKPGASAGAPVAKFERAGGASSKDVASALRGVKNLQDLDDRLAELQEKLSTSSMSMAQEKRVVAQISFLQLRGKEIISSKDDAYKKEKAAKDQRVVDRKNLEVERDALDKDIDKIKATLNEQRKVVDKLHADQDDQIKGIAANVQDVDRDAERAKISELKGQRNTLREAYQAEHEKWYTNERIASEQVKVQKRKRYEAAQAERDAKKKAWEAEQAEYPEADPYQPEKDMCAALIHLLQTTMGVAPGVDSRRIKADSTTSSLLPKADGVVPTLGVKKAAREVVSRTGAVKAIGKTIQGETSAFANDAYGEFSGGGGGGGSAKKNRRRKSDAHGPGANGAANGGGGHVNGGSSVVNGSGADEDKLKSLSIDHLNYFTSLGIEPPKLRSELKAALDAVLDKKKYYDNDPPAKESASGEGGVIGNRAGSSGGGASGSSASVNGGGKKKAKQAPPAPNAFPGLVSSTATGSADGDKEDAAPAPAAPVMTGPSFADIALGNARASEPPAPAADPTPGGAAPAAENGEAAAEAGAEAGEADAGLAGAGAAMAEPAAPAPAPAAVATQ